VYYNIYNYIYIIELPVMGTQLALLTAHCTTQCGVLAFDIMRYWRC
jgi:hypothetical protein